MNFQQKIAEIVRQRQTHLPVLEAEKKNIRALRDRIRSLLILFQELEGTIDFGQATELLNVQAENLSKRERQIEQIRRRFERSTINIGVSGQARVGKSTLLQSLSGLKDEQIPTGSTLEVTAVRSRIFNNNAGAPYALIKFLDEDAFFQRYVRAHLELFAGKIGVIPNLDSFASFIFPATVDAIDLANPQAGNISLQKLQEAQKALPYFRDLLTGGTKHIGNLDELRSYTAYPTNEEINNQASVPLQRLYLAVEDIQIFCSFPLPHLQGAALGLVDLPGLGNASKNIDAKHIDGLENGVDHVGIILNPHQAAFVGSQLVNNIDTLCNVQKSVKKQGMFTSIIINKRGLGEDEDEKVRVLNEDINRRINNNIADSEYAIYTINAKDPEDIRHFLEAILNKLISDLPVMDKEALEACLAGQDQTSKGLKESLEKINQTIDDIARQKPGNIAQISAAAQKLQAELAIAFAKRLAKLREGIGNGVPSPEKDRFYNAVDVIKQKTEEGINNRLWENELKLSKNCTDWTDYAVGHITAAKSPYSLCEGECHRIRIKIVENYEEMNPSYYNERLETFLDDVASLFREKTNTFLPPGIKGIDAIKAILGKLKSARNRMEHFERAFKWLEGLHFDFRQNVFPELREALEVIEFYVPYRDPPSILTGIQMPQTWEEQAECVHDVLKNCAIAANFEISKWLNKSADAVERFIFASLEHVDDLVIRNEDWLKEYMDFCNQFRNDLWPDQYGGINTDSTQKLSDTIAEIIEAL